MQSLERRLQQAAELLHAGKRIVAFTGAGISTESGIPDFRSPGGIWQRYRIVTYEEFMTDPSARRQYWKMKYELFKDFSRAKPNKAHTALVELEKMGKLTSVITQNIDGLHQMAGTSPDRLIQLHGTQQYGYCVQCGRRYEASEIYRRLPEMDFDFRCDDCGAIVKHAVVMFGEAMPVAEMKKALHQAQNADVMLMIGSSLQVEPAASVPRVAHQFGAKLIFINKSETPYDHIATVVFREPAGEVMTELIHRLKRM